MPLRLCFLFFFSLAKIFIGWSSVTQPSSLWYPSNVWRKKHQGLIPSQFGWVLQLIGIVVQRIWTRSVCQWHQGRIANILLWLKRQCSQTTNITHIFGGEGEQLQQDKQNQKHQQRFPGPLIFLCEKLQKRSFDERARNHDGKPRTKHEKFKRGREGHLGAIAGLPIHPRLLTLTSNAQMAEC